jgi:Flp pilus assembly protein TadG
MIEMATVAPFFFLVIFAVLEFGRYLWTKQVVTHATREGCRLLTLSTMFQARSTTVSSNEMSEITDRVKNELVQGGVPVQGKTPSGGITPTVTITIPTYRANIAALRSKDPVTLTATIDFGPLSWAPHTALAFFQSSDVTAEVSMEIE